MLTGSQLPSVPRSCFHSASAYGDPCGQPLLQPPLPSRERNPTISHPHQDQSTAVALTGLPSLSGNWSTGRYPTVGLEGIQTAPCTADEAGLIFRPWQKPLWEKQIAEDVWRFLLDSLVLMLLLFFKTGSHIAQGSLELTM